MPYLRGSAAAMSNARLAGFKIVYLNFIGKDDIAIIIQASALYRADYFEPVYRF